MTNSPQDQAVLLLTSHFSRPAEDDPRPLSPREWSRLSAWLGDRDLQPEGLLRGSLSEVLGGWADPKISHDRLAKLLARGAALGLAAEKWLRAGLWVMTRAGADEYPQILEQRLGADSPPVLYGCGRKALLLQGGVAVVGSRDANPADLDYARGLGGLVSSQGCSVVSGGARGIDEAAMLGALDTEGTAVGVLSDSLLRACSSARYRQHVKSGSLVLVSPFHPEAGFSAGKAMARNKYIYCLAQAAAVVHSGTTGGTWTGAHENLDKGWVPLWVRPTSDSRAGNSRLVEAGGRWLPDAVEDFRVDQLMLPPEKPEPSPEPAAGEQTPEATEQSFYGLFLLEAEQRCSRQPQTPDALATALELRKVQVADWLKQAVEDGLMDKLARPVRYRWTGGRKARDGRQIGLFENAE